MTKEQTSAGSLRERLAAASSRRFVGRRAEVEAYRRLLADPDAATSLLWVHGPGGVGKSTLLRHFAQVARGRGLRVLEVDARDVAPTPEGIGAALRVAMDTQERQVICLDTYERLEEADEWIRAELLPDLPDTTLLVLAGRDRPGPGWTGDPGWADLLATMLLGNLSPDESRTYLRRVGVPEARHSDVLAFTHGHPLALALVGEVARGRDFDPVSSPDVLAALLERLLRDVPGPTYREALEACAQVRVTDEALLGVLLDSGDVSAEFAWLRRLPFVDSGPGGLFPHDLAREVLDSDLRWRNPQRYQLLHERARGYYLDVIDTADQAGQQAAMFDLISLHPTLRPFLHAPGTGLRVTTGTSAHRAAVVDLVRRHEGDESADLARLWWDADPSSWVVVSEVTGTAATSLRAAMALGALPPPGGPLDVDPAVIAARQRLRQHAPLRPGERVTYTRWWLAADTYQDPSPAQNLLAVQLARHYLTTHGLAVTFLPIADPEQWAASCAYTDQHWMPEADFTVGGRRYAVFGHDWRIVPPAVWVAMLSERETAAEPLPPLPGPRGPEEPALLVLSHEEFAAAVRELLRDLHRPDRLAGNPLLRCRFVERRAQADPATGGQGGRLEALRAALDEAVATLEASPRDAKGYRAIHRTYVAPAPSQEVAAQLLGLPSSTYRRHLASGLQTITDILWQLELHA
jgi:hypothetical protein